MTSLLLVGFAFIIHLDRTRVSVQIEGWWHLVWFGLFIYFYFVISCCCVVLLFPRAFAKFLNLVEYFHVIFTASVTAITTQFSWWTTTRAKRISNCCESRKKKLLNEMENWSSRIVILGKFYTCTLHRHTRPFAAAHAPIRKTMTCKLDTRFILFLCTVCKHGVQSNKDTDTRTQFDLQIAT